MLLDVAVALGLPFALFYISKFLWRAYILWTANDPTSKFSHLPIPPGDFGIPIIGETITWALQGSRFNVIRRRKYGKIFSSNYIGKTMIKVTGPEYIKQVLTASYKDISTIWPTSVRRIVGEAAIANSIGAVHKFRRKAFLKAFTHAALGSYVPQIHRIVEKHMRHWMNASDTRLIHLGTKKMTFEVAFRVLVGLSFKSEEEENRLFQTFDTMITNIMSLPFEFPGSGFGKALKARKIIHGILDDHLKKKRKKVQDKVEEGEYAVETSDESLKNALHVILEAMSLEQARKQNGGCQHDLSDGSSENAANGVNQEDSGDHAISDLELKEMTVEMLFAGYQTVASSVTLAVFNLIKHPEVFRKLEDELRQYGLLDDGVCNVNDAATSQTISAKIPQVEKSERAIANNNNVINCKTSPEISSGKNREESVTPQVTLQVVSKMRYLEQVMRETLRVAPPILGGYRKAQKTFQLGKYRVPKGWTIIYNITDTHESEWSDRDFNPDRFSPENWTDGSESRFRWIPFGGGSRICVGKDFARLQFKLFVIELVRNFSRIEFANKKPSTMFAIPFLHPTDGLPVRLTPRKQRKNYLEPKKAK